LRAVALGCDPGPVERALVLTIEVHHGAAGNRLQRVKF
jgi:hypothetical protein